VATGRRGDGATGAAAVAASGGVGRMSGESQEIDTEKEPRVERLG
jgi:hypothetical protein